MMYAQVIDKEIVKVVDEQTLRELYPSTHFPSPLLESHLEGFDNWYVCEDETEVPEFDKASKKIRFDRELKGKKVIGSYAVIDLTNTEKDEARKNQWDIVKYHRNNAITSSDYLVFADVFSSFSDSDKEKIIAYRQALRDITDQTNPFKINWPKLSVDSVKLRYTMEA